MDDSDGYWRLPRCDSIVDRRTALVEWSRNKRVVHLGCVDEPILERRLLEGQLLHGALAAVATLLVGVDVAAGGLERLRELIPGEYVQADVQQLSRANLRTDVDLVLAPEIIEHLASPGAFVSELATFLRRSGAEAIITTPNAFSLANFVRFLPGRREHVHPDHLVLFSPGTLEKLLTSNGLRVVSRHVHAFTEGTRRAERMKAKALSAALKVNPWLGTGLIWRVTATVEERPQDEG